MTYATWDVETTTKTSFKRKANPFDPDNWVVTHGWKHKGQHGVTEYRFGHQRPGKGWLKPVLAGIRLLVGFNIKFDLLHALQDEENLDAWMDFVASGGNVWDCQIAEYLLCGMGQRDQMLSLDEVAPRYGGNVKVDEVKALWNAGVQTQDIAPELLSRYLCGGPDENGVFQLGDVENTERIALAQIQRARDAGQLNSILLNMGALLFTVEAERNGMYVDKARGLQLAEAMALQVVELGTRLATFLPSDLPFDFNWASPAQKSALIFGGTVYYESYEYDTAVGGVGSATLLKSAYDSMEPGQRPKLLYSQMDVVCCQPIEFETWRDHPDRIEGGYLPLEVCKRDGIPVVRYGSGKQMGEVKTKKVKVDNPDKPKGRTVKAPYTFQRITDPEPSWKNANGWSTSGEIIEELGDRDIPFLKVMAELQKLTKDLGTYYITTDPKTGEQSGMLTMVNALGIVHHMLNMCSTVTARLSSSNPNLQNIPKGNKSDVKTLFISRFGPDGKIIQSDFSSLEVYVQAILTQCKQLIEDLRAGLDLHCVRLAAKEHMEYEEVLKLAKGYKLPDGTKVEPVKEWDYKRTGAKVYSFQRAFGAGFKKIAASTKMAIEEVESLAKAEDERYPEIPIYYENITAVIKAGRKPMVTVPHPFVPGIMCPLGRSQFRTPDGKVYSYMEQPAPEYLVKRGQFASFSPTEIRNYVVQGTGGEWAKAGMWLAVRAFYAKRNFGGRALLVNQVHDAVYVDAAAAVAHEAAATLHAAMEAASDFMEWYFKWTIPVPVPSDTTWGASMMDEDSIPELKSRATEIRKELRTLYMNGYTPSFDQPVGENHVH